jgi:hypothetical protein
MNKARIHGFRQNGKVDDLPAELRLGRITSHVTLREDRLVSV